MLGQISVRLDDIVFKEYIISYNCFFYFQNTIRTPVYTTSLRRNAMGIGLVFEADLRTYIHNSFWILQGVCLLLNDD